MSQPFIGQIKMFAGTFAPQGYQFCNGQLLSIAENDALFALLGTTYGGDGQVTFGLPDFRGRIPVHQGTLAGGSTYQIGQLAGSETASVSSNQIPAHSHAIGITSGSGLQSNPAGGIMASTASGPFGTGLTLDGTLGAQTIGSAGNSQPHDNLMPYQCVSFIIAIQGIFPTQT